MNIRLMILAPLMYALLLGCALVEQLTPRPKPPAPISVEFRLVDESPASNAPELLIKGSEERVRLEPTAIIDNTDIQSAKVQRNAVGQSYDVMITFTADGARKLRAATAAAIGRRLAIVIDGTVIVAPTIQAEIPDGIAVVAGNFGREEAQDIADRLNSVAP
jgi:preprotein translocase subunit SecD